MIIGTELNKNNEYRDWHETLALTRGTIMTCHVYNFFEMKKI